MLLQLRTGQNSTRGGMRMWFQQGIQTPSLQQHRPCWKPSSPVSSFQGTNGPSATGKGTLPCSRARLRDTFPAPEGLRWSVGRENKRVHRGFRAKQRKKTALVRREQAGKTMTSICGGKGIRCGFMRASI